MIRPTNIIRMRQCDYPYLDAVLATYASYRYAKDTYQNTHVTARQNILNQAVLFLNILSRCRSIVLDSQHTVSFNSAYLTNV